VVCYTFIVVDFHLLLLAGVTGALSTWHEAPLWLSILGMAGIGGAADRDLRSQKLGANGRV
jgi:hypothetical protein